MSDHPEQVRIRSYEGGDLEACRALWVELTQWHRDLYDSPQIGGADPGGRFDEHLERVGPEHVWLAASGTEILGMVGLIPGVEPELEPIIVRDPRRGSGIGRLLAERVIAEARRAGARQLVTRPVARNAPAIRFFRGLGFDALGQVELLVDFRPTAEQVWRPGAKIADVDLRV
jgi:GNAT superfamily N-acetyltransferase